MAQAITIETKQTIIKKIRDEGLSVRIASEQFQVSTKTIYHWLRDGVTDGSRSLVLENRRLKQENEQLYAMLGRAMAELKRPKGEPSWTRPSRGG
jgi:transposase